MDKLPLWHGERVVIVEIDDDDERSVEEWVNVLFAHAPGWVCDAVLGKLDGEYSALLVEGLRSLVEGAT